MKFRLLAGCGLLAVSPVASQAQTVSAIGAGQPAVAQAAVVLPAAQESILRAGTEVPLLLREELTTKKKALRVGQRFQLEVASNVENGGVVVIPAGTPAVGEITEVRNKGMWGKSGYIGARVVSLRLGDRNVRLSGTFDDKGVTGTGGVVAAVVFVPIAGFLTTGTSAMIASGSNVKSFLDEDIAFRTVAVQPRLLDVPVAAPAQTTSVATAATIVPASVTTTVQK
ncbi:hypothetical protein [Novosphingobium sp. 9U]|uniref:hypothetical protein n=1 Tax=Novosphingobium sp. 9U TaxID=2653158 RepID=UPI0012F18C45|nr:hypothetical protein [Novosphingobium sp. 9U]VWX51534.1 conserved exported hypothetical protein [Novosphingobium sp. 9U]